MKNRDPFDWPWRFYSIRLTINQLSDLTKTEFSVSSKAGLAAFVSGVWHVTKVTFTKRGNQILTTADSITLGASSIHFDPFACLATLIFELATRLIRIVPKHLRTIIIYVTPKAWAPHTGIVAVIQTNAVTLLVFSRFGGVTVGTTRHWFTATRAAVLSVHFSKKDKIHCETIYRKKKVRSGAPTVLEICPYVERKIKAALNTVIILWEHKHKKKHKNMNTKT